MATLRFHVAVPANLAKEIDEVAGPRGRSAFLVELAKEIRRGRCWLFLIAMTAWRDEDHPEIAEIGSAAWVHNLRRERSARQDHLDEIANEAQK